MSAAWAVVLGASSGTGAAVARQVARDPGLDVFGVHRGRHPEGADEVARAVQWAGRHARLRTADAGTAEGAEEGADELLAVAGPRSVKLMVHAIACASVGRLASGTVDQLGPRQLEKTFDAMAHSFVYWAQALISRDLLAPGAHLLALSNPMDDPVVVRGTVAIAASKAALAVYVRHLAHELGPRGHRVNLLKFGAVTTPAIERTFGPRMARLKRLLPRVVPARRIASLDEVARFVSVLAGDQAAFFNGATIDFTGGENQALMDALLDGEDAQEIDRHEPIGKHGPRRHRRG